MSLEETLRHFQEAERVVATLMSRLQGVAQIPNRALVLDVGAAQGRWVAALNRLGHVAYGVEPDETARANARLLATHLGCEVPVVGGRAEALPFEAERFDVVLAQSVLEHVADLDATLREVFRVLRRGGVFWFFTASSVCPHQKEIRRFPLFGWYPLPLKRKIMHWAKRARPHLIGHTEAPAVNWFTPWMARSVLRQAGFSRVYDRWDLRRLCEGGLPYRAALRIVRCSALTKLLADVLAPCCAYAAVK
jgi:SAM-dependent methyltransferase